MPGFEAGGVTSPPPPLDGFTVAPPKDQRGLDFDGFVGAPDELGARTAVSLTPGPGFVGVRDTVSEVPAPPPPGRLGAVSVVPGLDTVVLAPNTNGLSFVPDGTLSGGGDWEVLGVVDVVVLPCGLVDEESCGAKAGSIGRFCNDVESTS